MSNIVAVRLIVISAFIGGCVFAIWGGNELYLGISSKNWVPVKATISEISQSINGRALRKTMDYSYSFENSTYSSSTVGFGLSNNQQDSVISPFKKGDTVNAYVNTTNPTQATLLRGFGSGIWFLLGMSLVFIAGSLFLAFSIREIPESA